MARFRLIPGGNDSGDVSDGGEYQCDCTANNYTCPCTKRFVIPQGQTVPNEPRCPDCQSGKHYG